MRLLRRSQPGSLQIKTTVRSRTHQCTQLSPHHLDSGLLVLNRGSRQSDGSLRLLHPGDVFETSGSALLGQVENGVLLLEAGVGYVEQRKLQVEVEVGARNRDGQCESGGGVVRVRTVSRTPPILASDGTSFDYDTNVAVYERELRLSQLTSARRRDAPSLRDLCHREGALLIFLRHLA